MYSAFWFIGVNSEDDDMIAFWPVGQRMARLQEIDNTVISTTLFQAIVQTANDIFCTTCKGGVRYFGDNFGSARCNITSK